MRFFRVFLCVALIAIAGACSEEMGAPPEQIAQARYVSDEPPYIAVVTTVNANNQRGAHTALVINASERVIYDPAGTFDHPSMPERGDIHYGADDRMLRYYERYHARLSHFVHVQKIPVSPAVAETALRRAQAQGPSPKAFCAVETVAILRDVPGFGNLSQSFYPENLRKQIAQVPGVQDRFRYEVDSAKALPGNG